MLVLVVIHGLFWSGLLSASATYVDVARAAEPPRRGHGVLGALDRAGRIGGADHRPVGLQPRRMDGDVPRSGGVEPGDGGDCVALAGGHAAQTARAGRPCRTLLEWRVLALSLCACSCMRSATAASRASSRSTRTQTPSRPRALYFTVFSLDDRRHPPVHRPIRRSRRLSPRVSARASRWSSVAFALLAVGGSRTLLITSAVVFGTGFGSAYPAFLGARAEVRGRESARRGVRQHHRRVRYRHRDRLDRDGLDHRALRISACMGNRGGLAACAIPFFIVVERRVFASGGLGPQPAQS